MTNSGVPGVRLPDLAAWNTRKSPLTQHASLRHARLDRLQGLCAGWPAALETALLLKEIASLPTEGMETREGATSGMYALGPTHIAVSLPTRHDPLIDETEQICAPPMFFAAVTSAGKCFCTSALAASSPRFVIAQVLPFSAPRRER